MPTISVKPWDLEALLGRKLPEAELIEQLAAAKAEHGGVNPEGDLRIELNDTNRPDLWSPEGVARQLRALLDGGGREYPVFAKPASKPERSIVVDAALREVRPNIAAFRAHGVAITEDALIAMIQTQEKLAEGYGKRRRDASVGIYNAAKITWPVHYVGVGRNEAPFVPLGFEEPMTPEQILERHPKGRDYAYILAGRATVPYLRDAAGVVLSMAPIINSRALGEVKPGDDDLMIEVTGTSLRGVMLVCNIFAADLTDRGFTCEPIAVKYPWKTELGKTVTCPHDFGDTVTLDLAEAGRLLGEKLEAADVTRHLQRYGCRVKGTGRKLKVSCPPWRMDFMHPVDAMEDYAMARGFGSFDPVMPPDFTVGALDATTALADRVRDHLIGCGFEETLGNVLTDRRTVVELGKAFGGGNPVELANPTSENTAVLRDALLPGLLRLEAKSPRATYPHRVFEVAEVQARDAAHPHGSHTEIHAGAIWAAPEVAFSDLHALLVALGFYLGWDVSLEPADTGLFIPGRSARVLRRGKPEGWLGEVHPETLDALGIRTPVVAFEVGLCVVRETGPE